MTAILSANGGQINARYRHARALACGGRGVWRNAGTVARQNLQTSTLGRLRQPWLRFPDFGAVV